MNFLSVLIILIKLESNSGTLDTAHTKYSWHIVDTDVKNELDYEHCYFVSQ